MIQIFLVQQHHRVFPSPDSAAVNKPDNIKSGVCSNIDKATSSGRGDSSEPNNTDPSHKMLF